MATEYDQAGANSDAQKRGALAALATGGTQGLAAYNQAISQANEGRGQALGAAAKRSTLIGGPEAAVGNYSAPINAAADNAVGALGANKNALGAYSAAMRDATGSYFDKVKAAVPIEELATLRQIAGSRQSKMTQEERDAQILGQSQSDLESATKQQSSEVETLKSKRDSINSQIEQDKKDEAAASQEYWKLKRAGFSDADVKEAMAKGGSVEDAAKAKRVASLNTSVAKRKEIESLQKQYADLDNQYKAASQKSAPALSDLTEKNAQKYGYTPEQARVLYGASGTKLSPYEEKVMKNTLNDDSAHISAWAAGSAPPSQLGIPLTKGKVSQEDFINYVNNEPGWDGKSKEYLITTYAPKFKTKKKLKSG